MKPLQSLKDTADHLGDQALRVRKRLHTMITGALKPLERKSPVAPRLKIEIVRDVCEQPAASPYQLGQQHFYQFAEFPAEIRLLIWHFASRTGRVIELQWSRKEIGFRNCAAPRPPAVLHTCRDSRKEALKIFQPYFSMEGCRKPIYVDPVNDILFFRIPPGSFTWAWRHEWMYMPNRLRRVELFREELKGIRRVAFLWTDFQQNSMPFSADPLGLLPDLEEFILLWADWSLRTFEGRGANFIEGISPCVHHVRKNVREIINDLSVWEERLGLGETRRDRLGSQRPTLTLRHWCLRDEEKENIL
jgi:hypothetical protein